MADLERPPHTDLLHAFEDGLRWFRWSRKQLQYLEVAIRQVHAIGKCPAGINGYTQIVSTLPRIRL